VLLPDERTPEHRYRIYRLPPAGELVLLATTPTAGGIGVALVTLHEEGEWVADEAVGVLDTHGKDGPGTWLVNPWAGPRPSAPDDIFRATPTPEEATDEEVLAGS
jgi:hypothetical protein